VYVIPGRSWEELPAVVDLQSDEVPHIVGGNAYDHLGWPIASGLWLPEGREAVLVVARRSSGGSLERHMAGEAYLIAGGDEKWGAVSFAVEEKASLSLIGQDEEDRLGHAGVLLDWNGDGRSEIAVAAPESRGWQNGEPLAGEVLVYFPSR
jgi:hypothetical protein